MARLPLAVSLLLVAPVATTRLDSWDIRLVTNEHTSYSHFLSSASRWLQPWGSRREA